jgi:hypothetical protein
MKPDACEWYALDMEKLLPFEAQDEAVAKFKAAHPGITFGRMTILGVERQEPWLCIEGWLTPPNDQGPEPTDADIPIGFA